MNKYLKYLSGGDLRSIAKVDQVISLITTQKEFDVLFELLFSEDRLVVMRAADAAEKLTLQNPSWLQTHKQELISLLDTAKEKELKWHLVAMLPRIQLNERELKLLVPQLLEFIRNKKESRIVRVFSLQALFDLTQNNVRYKKLIQETAQEISKENIPSLNSRIRKLKLLV